MLKIPLMDLKSSGILARKKPVPIFPSKDPKICTTRPVPDSPRDAKPVPILPSKDPKSCTTKPVPASPRDAKSDDGHAARRPAHFPSLSYPVPPDVLQKHPKPSGLSLKNGGPAYPANPANCAPVKVLISRPHPFTTGEPLDKYFSKYGEVATLSVIQHGRSDYAYINFRDPSSVERCCAESPHSVQGVTVTAPCSKATKGVHKDSGVPNPAKPEYSCSPLVVTSVEKDAKRYLQDKGDQVKVLAQQNKISLEGEAISGEMKDYVRKSISEHEAKVQSIDESLDCCYLPALVDPSVQKKLSEIKVPFNLWIIAYDDSKTPCDLYYASVEELTQAYTRCEEKTVCADELKKYVFPEVDGISGYQWYWEDDQSVFQPYTESVCNRLERAFSSKQTVQESIGKCDYTIDTVNMQQTNTWSGRRRRIRRQITKYSFSMVICAESGHIQDTRKQILDQLNSSLEKSTLSIPYVTWDTGFVDHLLQTARQAFVSADKASDGGNILTLRGVPDVVKQIEINSMKEIFFAASREGANTPDHWDIQKSKCELNLVQRGTKEWKDIEERMHEPKFNFRILHIERIQNLWQWEAYEHSRKRMSEKNHGIVNEKKLFHGCSETPPIKIYNSEQGFDNRLASKGVWGEGAYFAAKASYSNNYAHITPERHQQIFLTHVLTGMTCKCEKNRSIKAPPMKLEKSSGLSSSSSSAMFEDERYDSVSGVSDGSEVFVIYEHGKVYPAYLITYKPSRFF